MPNESAINLMNVATDANALAYRRAVQSSAPGDCWDFVILTAANEKQAQGYRQEMALRQHAVGPTGAFFPAIQKCLVVADPPHGRLGSGGATLAALRSLVHHFNLKPASLDQLRILMIHSGGASQRLPAYSAMGKIFAPLPLLRPDGQIATLFDHLYLTLAGLPERLGPGMLVVAGDVFLLFDHRHVTVPRAGVTAISMRAEPQLARDHGVFLTAPDGRITATLQKVAPHVMKQSGAADEHGRVLIDTGLLFFDPAATRRIARLAGCHARRRGLDQRHNLPIDLYEDITAALASATPRLAYLCGQSRNRVRRDLWNTLHGLPFYAMQLDGQFLHLGTTRQFRDAMVGLNPSPAAELFQQDVLTHSQWPVEPHRRVYHSVLLARQPHRGVLGSGCMVEHSILRAPSRIGAGSIVSQVTALTRAVTLGDDRLMFQVPVRTRDGNLSYVHVICGVDDDFKGSFADGQCRYLNEPIHQWLRRHRISAAEIWPGIPRDHRTLWTARLFPATTTRDQAPAGLAMAADSVPTARQLAQWRKGPRYSMAMILESADPAAIIEHRETVLAYLQASELIESIRRHEDRPIESLLGHYSTPSAYLAGETLLTRWAAQRPFDPQAAIDQSRALWSAAQLLQRPDHPDPAQARVRIDDYMTRSFGKIAQASEMGHASVQIAAVRAPRLRANIEIDAAAPVRLDLAGGWTDTPPYCFERGGQVINIAINLDGRPPVRAIVRTSREPRLILESRDLGRQIELKTTDPAVDVRDPFSLHKIALNMTGLLPSGRTAVPPFLKKLGCGMHVITECRVPKGSGLGTSSILAATLLAALHHARGHDPSPDELIGQTLLLEQRLSTGGGWQDQVGGIVGGVKSTITAPGVPQQPHVESLRLSSAQFHTLQDRLVVYYSGQQRLARDILRRVVGQWVGREPAVVLLQEELKRSATALRAALLKSQWSAVAREIARYWQIKKELYPGSTTPTIDVLFLELRDHYLAAGMAGAGGGGFAYFFCASAAQASRLRDLLAERSARPGSLGRVYSTQLNRRGLVVNRKAI